MKTIIRLAVILSFITILSNQKASAQGVTLDYFYDQLAPYGHWERIDPYGWTWQPDNISPEWRPYTDGYWIYTDYGWTYQADNDWSWAVYHYGRWNFNESAGWFWIPGTVWGPAWVAWRHSDQYIGWAPLPYEAEWREDGGFRSSGFNVEIGISWPCWSFVASQHFGDRGIHLYIENSARNVTYLGRTRNVTNYTVVNHQIYNNCITVVQVERYSRRKVEHYNIVESRSHREAGFSRENPQQFHVYRPVVESRRQADPPQRNTRNSEPNERVYQRHEQESRQYNDRSNQRYNDLLEAQRREEASHARKKVIQQHNTELRAFNEQRTVETKVLQNRQQQETKPQQQTQQREEKPQQQPQQQTQPQATPSRDNKTNTQTQQKSESTGRQSQSQTTQPATTNQSGNRR